MELRDELESGTLGARRPSLHPRSREFMLLERPIETIDRFAAPPHDPLQLTVPEESLPLPEVTVPRPVEPAGVRTRKKLIEVALPLDAINKASAREKSIRHGHPSTLHLWWARRPLAAARAVIFAQMVDDPSAHPGTLPDREGAGEGAPAAVPHHRGPGAVGEHHQRDGACRRRGTRSGRAGGGPAPRTPTIRARRSCSTGTSCPPSTIPSPAAGRCRWRRSGWGWRATPAT